MEGNYLIYVMTDLTSTGCARYYDSSVTIMSFGGAQFTVTRGAMFRAAADVARGIYNPAMLEIGTTDLTPAASPISLTLRNIIFDDAYLHEGTIFGYAPTPGAGTGTNFVQDGIVSSYAPNAAIILGPGAELRNFGGMTAVNAAYGATVIMERDSTITDIRPDENTNNREVDPSPTNWNANGEAAVRINTRSFVGGFFMYDGAKIVNISNAHGVKFDGTFKCFIDGEIAYMIGNKGMDTSPGADGRGFKNAVFFSGATVDPETGAPGPAVIGPNAYIHDNATKCGAVAVNRSTGVSVEIYGRVNDNTGGVGAAANDRGTNGGGLYIVAGGTIYLEDGCEIIGNKTMGSTSYGGAASIQQNGSKLIMNGGTVSGNSSPAGNTPASVGGIAVNKGNASFEMNGGTVDNGENGVWLFNNASDADCNGQLVLNAGTVSGVTIQSNVAYGTDTLNLYRNLYLGPGVIIGTGYVSVAGQHAVPLSADFNIGNPNKANYASIGGALPQGWTIPTVSDNVIGFWIKKSGTMEFLIPAPTAGALPTGYDIGLNVYFVAVQGTLSGGAADMGSATVFLPTTRDADGNIIVSVPLGTYPFGATVALVQPTTDYDSIEFNGPPILVFVPAASSYLIPYTASYEMPPGFAELLKGNGDTRSNTSVSLYIKPDPRTILDPAALTFRSGIFNWTGTDWDPVAGEWAVALELKDGWEGEADLTSESAFDCGMDHGNYSDGGVLTLTGQLVIKETYAGGSTYIIYGNQADTNMVIPAHTVTYDGNGADAGDPPVDPNLHAYGSLATVLGNIGVTGDGTDALVKSGKIFLGWSGDPNGTAVSYTAGGTFRMPDRDVILYAVWGGAPSGFLNYIITAAADDGSEIDPSGTVIIAKGSGMAFTFSAKPGYQIAAVYVDGAAISSAETASGKYVFVNVAANHTIRVATQAGGGSSDDGGGGDIGKKENGGDGNGKWAVLNLICAVLAAFTGIIALAAGRGRIRKDEEDERSKAAMLFRLLALVMGVVSIVIFFLTEDLSLPVAPADGWTLLMFLLLLAALITTMVSFRFDEDPEDEPET